MNAKALAVGLILAAVAGLLYAVWSNGYDTRDSEVKAERHHADSVHLAATRRVVDSMQHAADDANEAASRAEIVSARAVARSLVWRDSVQVLARTLLSIGTDTVEVPGPVVERLVTDAGTIDSLRFATDSLRTALDAERAARPLLAAERTAADSALGSARASRDSRALQNRRWSVSLVYAQPIGVEDRAGVRAGTLVGLAQVDVWIGRVTVGIEPGRVYAGIGVMF